jgi:hypothetical protein
MNDEAMCAGKRPLFRLLACVFLPLVVLDAQAGSLRFFGNGEGDIDRVKIRIDEPAENNPGPPADVGAGDFTIELWLRSLGNANAAAAIACGANNNWIRGNIFFDRDRYDQPRSFGISLGAGRVAFGALTSARLTICGTSDLRDGAWHHVAVQRRRADGRMWIYVDGTLQAEGDGPDGDLSYPDDGVPAPRCGPDGASPCTNSDPFIVIGAEKHDAGPEYPSFDGWVDELRLSTRLRYAGDFAPRQTPFGADAETAALYHFDEPSGVRVEDAAFNASSPGELLVGGNPSGPLRDAATPFTASAGSIELAAASFTVAEAAPTVSISAIRVGGSAGAVSADYATAARTATPGADYAESMGTLLWADGEVAPKGLEVAIVADSAVEGDEAFDIELRNPAGGASLGVRASAPVTIRDDDSAIGPGGGGGGAAGGAGGAGTGTGDRGGGGAGDLGGLLLLAYAVARRRAAELTDLSACGSS